MKKYKKITIAVASALLAITAASAVTGTLAWFTASNTVHVTGMQIQAEAEQGIVISNEARSDWKTEIAASHGGAGLSFVPTSTYNVSDWWHAYSTDANQAVTADTLYTHITPVESTTVSETTYGVANDGAYGFLENTSWKRVYLLNKFYVKSSTPTAITNQDIYVQDVQATVSASNPSQNLSKSLRVAFIAEGETTPIIFAPVTGADAANQITLTVDANNKKATYQSFTAQTTSDGTTHELKTEYDVVAYNDAVDTDGLEVSVYVYFEGEDDNCKSAYIPAEALEGIDVSFKLGNKNHD